MYCKAAFEFPSSCAVPNISKSSVNSTTPEVVGATVAVSVTGFPTMAFALTVSIVVVVVWAETAVAAETDRTAPIDRVNSFLDI